MSPPRPTVLVVAEKPSICTSIAHALCPRGTSLSTRGGSPPIHEFPGTFRGQNCLWRVTSVVGHVFSVDFPAEYQSWATTDPLDLFSAPVKRKAEKPGIVKLLQNESRGCQYLVLCLDADSEGENICFEVISCCEKQLTKTTGQQIFRARFSAINPSDIRKAMDNLGEPNENESKAVEARQELDLKVGVAFSRFQTQFFQGRYGDLDSSVISYGPCQTPTLGFCVRRYIDIMGFQSEAYWILKLRIVKDGRQITGSWDRARVFNTELGHMFFAIASARPQARVVSVKGKPTKKGRPTPLNTVGMLKLCSKVLGMGPYQAMQVAERLYLSGYISYPRTESTAYPASHDIKGSLADQACHPHWGSFAAQLVQEGHQKPRGGVDMGDHPPITPCRVAMPGELSGDMARLYDLVTRHFIATVSPDAEFFETKVCLSVGGEDVLDDKGVIDTEASTPGERFTARGRKMVKAGFLGVLKGFDLKAMRDEDAEEDEDDFEVSEFDDIMPDLEEGEILSLVAAKSGSSSGRSSEHQGAYAALSLEERKTAPPDYLTESELIGLMERNGIGTDASIPTHIENICKRNYVSLEKGRRLVPSRLGIVLSQGLFRIDPELILPSVRATIENQCKLIAKGQAEKEAVVKQAIDNFCRKYKYFVANILKMDELFSSSFSNLADAGRPWTRCGITKRYLSFIEKPPARLYNKVTETIYSLPQGGVHKQWNGRMCEQPGCGFEAMLFGVGSPQRTYPLCPYCYNNPMEEWGPMWDQVEGEDEQVRNRKCLECPLPDGHPLVRALTVCDDPESGGVFILDANSGPKWKFISTRSSACLNLPKGVVKKATVLKKVDPETKCHLVELEFCPGKSPLGSGELKHVGCVLTDPVFKSLLKLNEGSNTLSRKVAVAHGLLRPRGRGRGRRGKP